MKLLKNNFFKITALIFILFGIFIRYKGLGHSTYQGDEINAIRFLKDNYGNPSSLAIFTFYKLAKKVFDETTALFTAIFISLSGLYVAFSRITQYQSFMYLTVPIAVLVFINGYKKGSYIRIGLGGLLLSINMLGHYDTLSTLPFFGVVFFLDLINKFKNKKSIKDVFLKAFVFSLCFIIPSIFFYVPFLQGDDYSSSTQGYLSSRLFGSEGKPTFMPRLGEVLRLLKLYTPFSGYVFLYLSLILGVLSFKEKLTNINLKFINISYKNVNRIYTLLVLLYGFFIWFSLNPLAPHFQKPRLSTILIYIFSITIVFINLFYSKEDKYRVALLTWFLAVFCGYFFFIRDPRTHVYVTMIPGFAIAGRGIWYIFYSIEKAILKRSIVIDADKEVDTLYDAGDYKILDKQVQTLFHFEDKDTSFIKFLKHLKSLVKFGYILILLFLSLNLFTVFADTNPEYPWTNKQVLGKDLYDINRVRHKKIDGVFGFNHSRPWAEIYSLYEEGCLVGSYNSNEKNSVTSWYLKKDQDSIKKDLVFGADTLIGIEGPHSWYYVNYQRALKETPYQYNILKTFELDGNIVARIWGKEKAYPDGKMHCNFE